MNTTKLDLAKKFLSMGIGIIPLFHRGKKPETGLIGGTWEQYSVSLSSACDLESWLVADWRNYGVVAGWNNLVIIDFDDITYFNIWKLWSVNCSEYVNNIIERSFKVKTSRGIHVYVATVQPETNGKRISKKGGIDIQADRKFVVGPGSIHPSGHIYEPIGDMIFPVVNGIESILPCELFPEIVSEPETGVMPVAEIQPSNTEYDAFQSASLANDGVDLITKVKSAVRIETLFSNIQKSSPDGRWFVTLCPFHDDHNPSMWIDTRRQLCGCETCKMKPMDAINLYSRMHGMNESLAVSELARVVGVWG